MKKLLRKKEFSIFLIIVFISIVITVASPTFLRPDNLIDVLKGNVVLGIMALGMLPVLISGGIDLSVTGTIALSAVLCGKLMVTYGSNIWMVFLLAVLIGAGIGFLDGIIIAKLRIPPIVTTLGMQSVFVGIVLLYTNGDWITNLPPWFKRFGTFTVGVLPNGSGGTLGIPVQIVFLIAAGLITWFVLKYTLIGRGIYAIGGSRSSALRVGYNIDRIQVFIYMYCGVMAGIAGVLHTSIVQQVDPNTFTGMELNVIVAVVIGGASTVGGSGTVFGTFLGVILMAVLENGMVLARIPTFWQKIVMGIIILIATSFDVINHKREQNKLVRVDIEE